VTAAVALVTFAKESAEAAKAAQEAGETLTDSQLKWLDFSAQLDTLDASVANAKSALGGILLPALRELSVEGASFLDAFSSDLEAAAGDAGKQGEVLAQYIVKGANLVKGKLPAYIAAGKSLFAGLKQGLSGSEQELLDEGVDMVFDLLETIIDSAPELGQGGGELIQKLVKGLEERSPELAVSGVEVLTQFVSGLAQGLPQLIAAGPVIVESFADALTEGDNMEDILSAGGTLLVNLTIGIINAIGSLATTAIEVLGKLGDYLEDPANQAELLAKAGEVGGAIANAIWNGLVSVFNSLKENFPSLLDGISAGISGAVIGSSGLVGAGGVPGFSAGLDYVPYDNFLARLHEGEMVLTSVEAAAYRRERTSGNAPKIVNLTFNAKTITEADVNMVVDIVNRKLGDDL
jgi:hypothetical protein